MTPEQALRQALNSDKRLLLLYAERAFIISYSIPMVVLIDGQHRTIWIDEKNNPKLLTTERLIQQRIDELTRHYLP